MPFIPFSGFCRCLHTSPAFAVFFLPVPISPSEGFASWSRGSPLPILVEPGALPTPAEPVGAGPALSFPCVSSPSPDSCRSFLRALGLSSPSGKAEGWMPSLRGRSEGFGGSATRVPSRNASSEPESPFPRPPPGGPGAPPPPRPAPRRLPPAPCPSWPRGRRAPACRRNQLSSAGPSSRSPALQQQVGRVGTAGI